MKIIDNKQLLKRDKRIHILHIIDGYRFGGAESKLLELIQNTDYDKFNITLVNVGPNGPLKAEFEKLKVNIFNYQRSHRFDILPFVKLFKLIRKNKIDIVQTTLFWADFVGSIIGKLARVKLIISWETVTHTGKFYHSKMMRRNGYRLAFHLFDVIIAVSNEVKSSLIQYNGLNNNKVRVIHYGVNLEEFKPLNHNIKQTKREEINLPRNSTSIAVVGRLELQKGHIILINAVEELIKKNRNLYAIFVGEGSYRKKIENQIREHEIEDNVKMLGIRTDVCQILNAVDIFCLPSIAGEGLSNAILEAMACGKPVVATDVGGAKEVVHNGLNGFLVPPNDEKSLKLALSKLINDPELLGKQSSSARNSIKKHFSLEQQIKTFKHLYLTCSENSSNNRKPLKN